MAGKAWPEGQVVGKVTRGTGEKLFPGGLESRGGRVYRSLTLGACLHQPGLTT